MYVTAHNSEATVVVDNLTSRQVDMNNVDVQQPFSLAGEMSFSCLPIRKSGFETSR